MSTAEDRVRLAYWKDDPDLAAAWVRAIIALAESGLDARDAVDRMRVLIAPETAMAATTAFGQRCFTEADIRRDLDGEAS